MGATNHTTNYSLSQFIGTDKPSWLNDYNGDMSSIDTAIHNAATAANTADTKATNAGNAATSAQNTANTLDSQINTPVTGLAAVVSGHTTSIGSIQADLGNTPLPTVAQTISGAIDELYNSGVTPESGTMIYKGNLSLSVTYDGVKTFAQAMNEVYTSLVSTCSALAADEYVRIVSANFNYPSYTDSELFVTHTDLIQTAPTEVVLLSQNMSSSSMSIYLAKFAASSTVYNGNITGGSFTRNDYSTTVPTSGNTCYIKLEKYKVTA